MSSTAPQVLVVGATGFVGRRLTAPLSRSGFRVRHGSRQPAIAATHHPQKVWVHCDVSSRRSLCEALSECSHAIYLFHGMAEPGDFEQREREAAERFVQAASDSGLERLVYLGGMIPSGEPSKHLRSRLATGEVLRSGPFTTIELQASMIMGAGSESWTLVRDLSTRLPFLVLPRWAACRSQPIGIDDVLYAIVHALRVQTPRSTAHALPGPETLSIKEILLRVAALQGLKPRIAEPPFVPRPLPELVLGIVSRAHLRVARELIEGLRSDILSADEGYWRIASDHRRIGFDEAARRALRAESFEMPLSTKLGESLLLELMRRGARS